MRQNYDVEIQAMFLELNRVKEDMLLVKGKCGIGNNNNSNNNDQTNSKIVLGGNSGLAGLGQGGLKRDERRYEMPNSSAGSSIFGGGESLPARFYRRHTNE